MKTRNYYYLTIALLVAACFQLKAQITETYKHRAKVNFNQLVGPSDLSSEVRLDDRGINFYKRDGSIEFSLFWSESAKFINKIETMDYKSLLSLYKAKGRNVMHIEDYYRTNNVAYTQYPTNLSEVRIAIDPGHFAGNFLEAIREERYVKMHGNVDGTPTDFEFFEAELTSSTADIIKAQLIEAGAQPENILITREFGKDAMGTTFDEWYVKKFKSDLDSMHFIGEITGHERGYLLRASKEIVFSQFYKILEFKHRVRKINEFYPMLTLVIHYNAEEKNIRDAEGFLNPVADNYSVAFIPGSFIKKELSSTQSRIDFLRLLMSTDFENSLKLAGYILDEYEKIGVPPLPVDNSYEYIRNACIPTTKEGVYSRNLALTRGVRGVVVYLECLYQDNYEEAKRLSMKDYPIGNRFTSKRCFEFGSRTAAGVLNFLEFNSSLTAIGN